VSISAARVTVAATAVALNTASPSGLTLAITNLNATAANGADLGLAAVTAGAGYFLAGGATVVVPIKPYEILYAISSTANTVELAVLRT
jgi:hypothetical protein